MAALTQVRLRPWSLRKQHPQHVMYPQAAVIIGPQGYTRHFHQCRARGPPSLCQGTHGGITVEDRILMYQVINHFLSPNAMCPQHGWDGACILQGVWVEHCTLHSAQLLLQQPLQDGARGPRDRDRCLEARQWGPHLQPDLQLPSKWLEAFGSALPSTERLHSTPVKRRLGPQAAKQGGVE